MSGQNAARLVGLAVSNPKRLVTSKATSFESKMVIKLGTHCSTSPVQIIAKQQLSGRSNLKQHKTYGYCFSLDIQENRPISSSHEVNSPVNDQSTCRFSRSAGTAPFLGAAARGEFKNRAVITMDTICLNRVKGTGHELTPLLHSTSHVG